MSYADRLKRALESRDALVDPFDANDSQAICRAIVDEFELDDNCECRLGHHCESCAKMVLLGDAIIDVAEADDEQ